MSISEPAKFVTLLESDLPKLIMAGPLSSRTTYTLRVDGPWGVKELRALLQMLTAQIEILEEPKP